VNPHAGTLGTAAFARFAVQVALEYQIDPRQLPANISTQGGYWSYNNAGPGLYPTDFYGTEVFELNTNLLARALDLVKNVTLSDNNASMTWRAQYDYAPANQPPTIVQSDVVTSDVYFAGSILGEGFGNLTKTITNGSATYCMTAQEDNATLESLMRATLFGYVDYGRAILVRTASDVDRAPPNVTEYDSFEADQGGFETALTNIYLSLWPVVKEIAYDWPAWENGTAHQSGFYGDVLGTLSSY